MPISPPAPADTKGRTGVLGDPCPEPGFDDAVVDRTPLGDDVRDAHRAGQQQGSEA